MCSIINEDAINEIKCIITKDIRIYNLDMHFILCFNRIAEFYSFVATFYALSFFHLLTISGIYFTFYCQQNQNLRMLLLLLF